MPSVFGMGEILVDKIYTVNGEERWLAGGSVFNTMMDLYLMGIEVAFQTSLARDDEGNFLMNTLMDSGFSTLYHNPSEKTLYAEVTLDGNGNPVFRIKNREKLVLNFGSKHESILKSSSIFHTSAFSLNYSKSRDAILKAFDVAKRERIFCSFDLNMRSLEGDIKPDELRKIVVELMIKADYCKPSRDDLSLLFPALSIEEVIEFLKNHTQGNIVVTNGDDPIIYIKNGSIKEIAVKKEAAVDGTGAGDAFNAAVIASVLKGKPFLEAIETGKLLASMVVKRYGALATSEDVKAIKNRI
ncbi:hypothetical protein AT15_01190 [Kosmotoga arenicorallina S304]|uniref:Carbohydrate kinase PfkB domain-containing protein n=1 Tax=Kosmotoga arenicorallina S304 TaxID=1453497 RepID=A0A176K0C6_9BACT|nr:PfkB family carbohydrate kinase [Kosmotoga arenicorallina]OAA29920.1 hypothetical protein AT15_01190 [Kosmotoga arenicorallina S304]